MQFIIAQIQNLISIIQEKTCMCMWTCFLYNYMLIYVFNIFNVKLFTGWNIQLYIRSFNYLILNWIYPDFLIILKVVFKISTINIYCLILEGKIILKKCIQDFLYYTESGLAQCAYKILIIYELLLFPTIQSRRDDGSGSLLSSSGISSPTSFWSSLSVRSPSSGGLVHLTKRFFAIVFVEIWVFCSHVYYSMS